MRNYDPTFAPFRFDGTIDHGAFSPEMQIILKVMHIAAQNFGHALVGRRHLIYACLRQQQGFLTGIIQDSQLDITKIRLKFSNLMMPVSMIPFYNMALEKEFLSHPLVRVFRDASGRDNPITEKKLIVLLYGGDPEDPLIQSLRQIIDRRF